MKSVESSAFQILTLLPETFSDFDVWRDVLTELKTAASAPHALISFRDKTGTLCFDENAWEHPFVSGFDGKIGGKPYLDYYRQFDAWDKFENQANIGNALITSKHLGAELGQGSEFWDWLIPLDINENAVIKLFDTPQGWLGLNLQFDNKHTNSDDLIKLLNLLQKPLAQTIFLQENGFSADPNQKTAQQLDDSAYPQLRLNAEGRILEINKNAERYFHLSAAWMKVSRTVLFSENRVQQRFKNALKQVVTTRLPQIVAVPSHQDNSKITLVLAPDERADLNLFEVRTNVLVTIVTKIQNSRLVVSLGRAHGFNDTQIDILRECEKGLRPNEIAKALNLSDYHTRTTLSHIYEVLGVKHQSALIAFLSSLNRI